MVRFSTVLLICLSLAAIPVAAQAPPPQRPTPSRDEPRTGPDVAGALAGSFALLAIEHGIRVGFQQKTRDALRGPFWSDYRQSLRVPHQWEDADGWLVNYIGHPVHGAAAGYIWLDHEPSAPVEIGLTKKYWASRGRAAAWAGVYSLQFEFGPLSEASIGNVGMRPETTGWVDHVVTPVGAFGLIVGEDALDRFFVKWIEKRATNRVWRASMRLLFNPGRTLSNTASGHLPWYREGRPLGWR